MSYGKDKNDDEISGVKGFFKKQVVLPIKRFKGLTEKEVSVLFNDKLMMIITYLIPIIVILILTVGISGEIISEDGASVGSSDPIVIPKIGLIDLDTSDGFLNRDLSVEFYDLFKEQEELGFVDLYETTNQSELESLIGRGEISAYIIIPQLFEFNLSIGLPVIVPFVLDAIDFNQLQYSQIVVNTVVETFREDNGFTGVFKIDGYNVNVPTGKSQMFFAAAPYFIPLILFAISTLVSSQCIVGDIPKDRMVLTPTNKFEMMGAKFMGNFLVMTTVVGILLITSAIVQLDIKSSWLGFFICMEIIIANGILFGVSISAIARSPLAAFQYFIFIFLFMTVAVLFISDPLLLPLFPLYIGGDLITNVVLRGQSLWTVRDSIKSIAIESVAMYLVAYLIFKKQKTML